MKLTQWIDLYGEMPSFDQPSEKGKNGRKTCVGVVVDVAFIIVFIILKAGFIQKAIIIIKNHMVVLLKPYTGSLLHTLRSDLTPTTVSAICSSSITLSDTCSSHNFPTVHIPRS